MKKKVIGWIILLAIIGGSVYYFVKPKKSESKYITAKAKIENIKQTVSVIGKVEPINKTILSFETGGTIKNIPVEIGDRVKKGQIVAVLDTSILQSQINEALISLNIQEENLKFKRRKWDSYKPEEKATFKLAVDKARKNVQVLQSQLEKYTLRAPNDGIIIEKKVEKDETIQATMPVITVMSEDSVEIKGDISETDIAKVKIGQNAEVTFDAFPSDKIFTAKVVKIDPAATIIQDVIYYKVTFDISENENNPKLSDLFKKIKIGMSADLDILIKEKNNALTVPIQAVKEKTGKKYVEVLSKKDDKEIIEKVFVQVGFSGDNGLIEIISGINNGDDVVTFVKEK